jgi:hypothetical protein
MTDIEDLAKRIEDLAKRVERIEQHLGFVEKPEVVRAPWPRVNPIDQLEVPPNVIEAMVKAVPTSVVREIVKDGRRR